MSQRTEAIENEEQKTRQGGGSRYSYVNTGVLERLGVDQYKADVGDNYLRIIPPMDPKEFYGREIFVHYNVGADGNVYLCLKKMYGEPCSVCEYRAELKEKNPEDEMLKALAYSRRYLFLVYNVFNQETEEKGLHWFDSPLVIKDNIVSLSKNRRTGETLDISDPVEGRDIEFVRRGKQKNNTRYEGFKLVEGKPIPESWYQDIPTFDDVLLKPDYDEVKQQVRGVASSSKAEETEDKDKEETSSRQTDKAETRGEKKTETRGEARGESRGREKDSSRSDDGKKSVRDKINEIRNGKKGKSDE